MLSNYRICKFQINMFSLLCISESKPFFNDNESYLLHYYIEPLERINIRLEDGFVPNGPVFLIQQDNHIVKA